MISSATNTKPVEDTVPKINHEFAVGSDLEFQRWWRRLEQIIWPVLLVFLILSFAGVFGRGPVANAQQAAADHSMTVRYERIQRFGTPSVITIDVAQSAIQKGNIKLWASDSLVKPLGNQRVMPAPIDSQIGRGGILYTFPATQSPASIEFQTQPAALGSSSLTLEIPGHPAIRLAVFVMP